VIKNLLFILLLFLVGCTQVKYEHYTSPNKAVLLNLHNQERLKQNLQPLSFDNKLNNAAQIYAEQMAQTNIFDHGDLLSRIGEDWSICGENIAKGQKYNEEVMQDWLNSIGHRENIYEKKYEKIGIGIAVSKDGIIFWVVDFAKQ
jgi:uncharacterized protein YkwD